MRSTILFVCLVALCHASTAFGGLAVDLACKKLFRQKAYSEAGACFERFIQKPAKKADRTRLGRRIRNAVTSYRKAAAGTPNKTYAAYFRERALLLMKQYLRWKLYENPHRKNSALVLVYKLQKKIGYTLLTVLTSHPKSQIQVMGYLFDERRTTRQWSKQVRPGSYRVIVFVPGRKEPYSRKVKAHPGIPVFLQVKAPKPRAAVVRRARPKKSKKRVLARLPVPKRPKAPAAKKRPLQPVLLGVLIATCVAGITSVSLWLAGNQVLADRDKLHQDAPAPAHLSTTKELHRLQLLGGHLWTSSAITAGVSALGLLGSGVTLALLLARPKPPPHKGLKQPKKTGSASR